MLRITSVVVVAAFSALAACNANVLVDRPATTGGQGGQGAGGGSTTTVTNPTTTTTTTTTSTSTVPAECAVATADPGPYAVTFRVTNHGGAPAFVRQECHLKLDVYACADGWGAPLPIHGDCMVDCSQSGPGCMDCGACMDDGVAVDPGQEIETGWGGVTLTYGKTVDGCDCKTPQSAPAAKYRVNVPVYASKEDAAMNKVAWEAVVDFELPTPGGVVEVPVGAH